MIDRNGSDTSNASPWKTVTLSSLGSALEYFDFVIYAVFAASISKEYFPSDSALTSLFNTFLLFAGGYVMRPVGGIVFSHIGDRFGRKPAFLASMLLMSITMIAMAIIPNHASWGLWATIGFTLLRLLQGLSIGGEVPSALTYVVESAPQRGVLGCALVMAAMLAGVLLATGSNWLLSQWLPSSLVPYAWRIAFTVGGVLGLGSYFLRRKLLETQVIEHHVAGERLPFFELIRNYPRQVAAGVGIAATVAVYSALVFAYLPAYLVRVLGYDSAQVSSAMLLCLMVGPLVTVAVGWIGDSMQPHLIHRFAASVIAVGAIPTFGLLERHGGSLPVILVCFTVVGSLAVGTHAWILADLFPKRIRCTGIAVAYNISYAFFGGFTPVLVTGLIKSSGNNAIPGTYLAIVAALAVLTSLFIPRMAGHAREGRRNASAAPTPQLVARGSHD